MNDNYHLLGKGVYSIQDAMAFSGLSFARVRHWIRGDKRSGKFGRKENSPIICLQHGIINGVYTLGFLDLVELLMISKINEEGISVRAIRSMHDNAQNWLEKSHPFAYYKIYTAGIDLIIKLSDDSGDEFLLNMRNNNIELKDVTEPYLKDIDFSNEEKEIALRWWPFGRDKSVVIDPNRFRGHPIVAKRGVSTLVLAESVKAEGSIRKAAHWYQVDETEVRDAYDFETIITKRVAA